MQHKNREIFCLIENFINDYYQKHGYIPKNYQIAEALSLSTATISRYINQMKKDGTIFVDKNNKATTFKIQKMINSYNEIPVVGTIACGNPILAEENIENYIIIPEDFIGRGEYFFLRTKGKSMFKIGIDDGDLVLIKKQNFAENGDIAVVLIEDEATLKRIFFEKNGLIRLHPENDDLEDFYVKECNIQGVAVKTIKNIQ